MIHRSGSIRAAEFLVVVMLAVAGSVHAQVPWNCPQTTVVNNSGCDVLLQVASTPVGLFPPTLVPIGGIVMVPTAGITSLDSVFSAAGFWYLILPPTAACASSCGLNEWRVCCVKLPPMGCCCDVCFNRNTCTITINPAQCFPPGPCRP